MSEIDDDFFEGKRPWSIIKDQILRKYMDPYLAKVNRLGRPILLIDAYAGPGIFDDGQPGSPYIICQAAERHAKGNYTAIFVNKMEKHHEKLKYVLRKEGWSGSAHAYLADSRKRVQLIPSTLKDHTVFLYLDPFGLKGCEFATLEPFLERNTKFSTEVLLTMSMPIVHRLAARHKAEGGPPEEGRIRSNREMLTKIFGGNYWRDILLSQSNKSVRNREIELMEAYRNKLKQYLPFTGSCPVRTKNDGRTKYFIVFASRHPDAMLLLNDIMLDAYFSRMHEIEYAETLFSDLHWSELPPVEIEPIDKLETVVLHAVAQRPGATREEIWLDIIQNYFMRYRQTDYKKIVQRLVESNKLVCPTPRRGRQLNDDCCLYLSPNY
jgi:three-Cys-motif partner protein